MIADGTFSSIISTEVINNLRTVGEEFDEAVRQNSLTEHLGRKYHGALKAYENQLYDCPYSPMNGPVQPSAHDSMMFGKVREELARIQNRNSLILDHFGGALSLDED